MTPTRWCRRTPRPSCIAAASLALLTAAAHGQAADGGVQRIEIVGTTPITGSGIDRDRVPANVQAATAAEMDRSNAGDLSSFLARRIGSVHVNEIQNNPFQPDVNYRGFTASPLLGTAQGLSIYLDGVRLNQPFGEVVSWDLIPRSALSSMTLMPGSNPLFGLNTLGGALALQTKDGLRDAGTEVQLLAGQYGRRAAEFEHGGSDQGVHWFVTGNRFRDGGWRDASPTDVTQLFGKAGVRRGGSDFWAGVALARTDLTGNGLQEMRLLARDHGSIYTKPDETANRGLALTLSGAQELSGSLAASGVAYARRIKTRTLNGDLNDDALTENVYQPTPEEQQALTDAGYTGFPTAGEDASNTPFPKWRCIANALLVDEPAEKCNGVLNRTNTEQDNFGFSAQLQWRAPLAGLENLLVAGVAVDASRIDFQQGSELGYLNPDRGVTGVGAFGDGVSGGLADGEPYDTRVNLASRTRTWSVFATDTLSLSAGTHLTLSARYNRTRLRTTDNLLPGGGAGSLNGDHTFSRLNPAAGLTFAPMGGMTGYVGVSQGSRAPSAIELGCADPANPCKLPNAFAGDPPLNQVIARTVEAGLRSSGRGDTRWNVGVFRTDNTDDILFVADNAAGFGYFRNFGKTRRQGLEAGFSTRLFGATIGAQYTLLDATYESPEIVNGASNSSNRENVEQGLPGVEGTIAIEPGQQIPGQPRHMLKLFAELPLGTDVALSADLAAVGGSLARGNENGQHQPDGVYYLGPGRSGGYAVFNLGAEYKPTAGLRLFAQVNNVFDRKYSTAAQLGPTGFDENGSFAAQPFPANAEGELPLRHSTFYAAGAPRTVWVGVRYAFGR